MLQFSFFLMTTSDPAHGSRLQRIDSSNPQHWAVASQPTRRPASIAVTSHTGDSRWDPLLLHRRPLIAHHGKIHHSSTHLRHRLRDIGSGYWRHRDNHTAAPTGTTAAVLDAEQAHPTRTGTTLPAYSASPKDQQKKHRQ